MAARTTVRITVQALLIAVLGLNVAQVTPALAQEDKKESEKATLVGVDTVIEERTHQTIPVIGRLVAQRSGVVSVLTKGVVADVLVRVGDRVHAGDDIARLLANSLTWSRELRVAEVNSAKASLANAKSQTSLRRQELKRLNNLKKSAAFSAARYEDAQKELSKAKSDAARAEAELARATANLNLAQIDLDNATIKAPYPGVVSAVHTEVGTYLNTGQPVVTMVDDSTMEIEADVPAAHTQGLLPGTHVSFTTGLAISQSATVRAVVPDEKPLTRTRAVRFAPVDTENLEGAAANQTVSINIPAGPERTVMTVHKDAVLTRNANRVVYVLVDGKAELRSVTLGETVGTRFTVIAGLKIGDTVVVRGNERLAPGQDIQANTSAPASRGQ